MALSINQRTPEGRFSQQIFLFFFNTVEDVAQQLQGF